MNQKKAFFFFVLFLTVFLFCFQNPLFAQEAGQVSEQQKQAIIEAVQDGRVDPGMVKQFQEQGKLGDLTPEEIEAGKKILEEKKAEAKEEAVADEKAEPKPEDSIEKKEPEEPAKEPKPDEDFFKKSAPEVRAALEIFGHKLFSSAPSTFAPITAFPVSNDYIIGPGDEIKILMWGRLDASYSLEVDSEGVINFPKIGPLTVAGITFGELKELIKQKAEAITGVNVNVSMGRLRTIQVFVLGEVKAPGVYTVSSLATIANALLSSGGPTELGSLRRVELKRHGKVVSVIDLYDFLLKGDTTDDTRLMPGDVIFVPQAGPMVSVAGNVKRPAVYELKERKTLDTALSLAGGLKPRAYNQRIQIERAFENRSQIVLDISHAELIRKKPVPLTDGDLIRVFSIIPSSVNAVFLYGNVARPGEYAYSQGLRVSDILPDTNSLLMDTYFDYALIKRYRLKDMQAELVPFDLGRLVVRGDRTQDIALMPRDEVYVFHKQMFEDRPYAVVEGEVRKPGRYFIDDMRMKDIILKAGDLTEEAYLPKAELIRIEEDRRRITIYFDAGAALAGDPGHNIKVRNEDRIVIHSVWEEQWKESVTIGGEVKNKGEFTLTRGMRIKDLVFKAGSFTRDAYMGSGHLYRTDWRTKEKTILTFDVGRAMEGDPRHNLLLQDLDNVVIHSTWEYAERYEVSIDGMVNNPGSYPYAANMTVRDLILVAGNLKDAAYTEEAEIVRYDIVDGKKVETSILSFDVEKALKKDANHDLALQPMDLVHIKEIPEWWEKKKFVTVTGEVSFPGRYHIRKEERLSDILERAGGFTDQAYLRGAVFTREDVRQVQEQRLRDMMKEMEIEIAQYSSTEAQTTLDKDDLAAQAQFISAQKALVAKLKESRASGRVVINLTPLSILRGSNSDLILEAGDTLHIPEKSNTVSVLGAVYNPTALVYEKGEDLNYYLARTGGPTDNAEEGQMYIVRADGTVISKKGESWMGVSWNEEENRWGFWGKFAATELEPGDTVLVPRKVVKPAYMRTFKDITQILYQIAVIAGITITQVF